MEDKDQEKEEVTRAPNAEFLNVGTPDVLAASLLKIASWISLLFVALILAAGLLKIALGILEYAGWSVDFTSAEGSFNWSSYLPHWRPERHDLAIASLMGGLEYFLLAPLAYVLPRTLATYIDGFRLSLEGKPSPASVHTVIGVKALLTGLLIAVLGTHLVGVLITEATGPENHSGNQFERPELLKTLCGIALLLALAAYYKILEDASSDKAASDEAMKKPYIMRLADAVREKYRKKGVQRTDEQIMAELSGPLKSADLLKLLEADVGEKEKSEH